MVPTSQTDAAAPLDAPKQDFVTPGCPGTLAWFPRPRGAAPHGPGGVPKRWSNSMGCWETAGEAEAGAHARPNPGINIISRPRGAVRALPIPSHASESHLLREPTAGHQMKLGDRSAPSPPSASRPRTPK